MSQVKISGNASGTGVLTIAAPNTNTDRTLDLPDSAGEIVTNKSTPMFSAKFTSDSSAYVTTQTHTIVRFDTEIIDTEGWYDHTTYKFTPQQAGYYVLQFNCQFQRGTNNTSDFRFIGSFLKNGSTSDADIISGGDGVHVGTSSDAKLYNNDLRVANTTIMYFNGSTDFTAAYFYQNSGATVYHRFTSGGGNVFSGYLLRAT